MKIVIPRTLLCALALLAFTTQSITQDNFDFDAERKRAFQLIEENKFPDALPILEKLAAAKPGDAVVLERLALALAVSATTTKKAPEQIRKDLIRARQLAEKAKSLGNESQIVQMLLEQIPADGVTAAAEKKRTPAEEALFEGESAFAQGDLTKALAQYEKAAQLDPKLYEAPLFIGDVHFKQGNLDKAGEGYARAIAIDPDRETAYRYWGNVLMGAGKSKEAREKFIEAIIADPYNRLPWQFLINWAKRNGGELSHPRIDVPKSSVTRKDDNNIDIRALLSDQKDGTSAWTAYSIARAAWMVDDKEFKKAYPNEPKYRHSLREETVALGLTVESVQIQLKEGSLKEKDLNVSIANLLKLHKAGLVEAYVLLAMPDEGIARDYAGYRKDHREKLRQYLTDYVTAGK